MIDSCKCNWCSETFEKRYSCNATKKQNHKSSDVRIFTSARMLTTGLSLGIVDVLLASTGLMSPAKSKWHENYQKSKPHIMDVPKTQMKNRLHHSSKSRSMKE